MLFAVALGIVCCIGLAWSTAHQPGSLPSARHAEHNLIFVARYTEDVSWLELDLPHIAHIVYQVGDNSTAYGSSRNVCKEAEAYLTYIVDHYHSGQLPKAVAFVHGHRGSWHLKDKVPVLAGLQWHKHGFANLRHANLTCPKDWQCRFSRTSHVDTHWTGAWLHPKDYKDLGKVKEPIDRVHWVYEDEAREAKSVAEAWDPAFQGALGPLPGLLHSPCCAEFVVSRSRILQRPLSFYVHLRDWAISQVVPPYICSRVLEHTWAMIFGEPAVSEAKAECDLLFCGPSWASPGAAAAG